MNRAMVCFLSGVILIGGGCGAGTVPDAPAGQVDEAAAEAVSKAAETYAQAWRVGDAAAAAAILTEDAVISAPQQSDIRGRAGAEEIWTGILANAKVTQLDVRPEPIVVSGDLAMEAGEYDETIEMEDQAPVKIEGRYLIVWQRQTDGAWKIIRFMALDRPGTAEPVSGT